MSWINRLRGSLRMNRLEDHLHDELQFHIEMRMQEFVAAGMKPEEAGYRARRLFGNPLLLKERTREMDTISSPLGTIAGDGKIAVPDKPGLGIDLDLDVAYRYRKPGEKFFD
jgi:L-alanine-DL-glutamate epimerase-like enolase superfamily enzyme